MNAPALIYAGFIALPIVMGFLIALGARSKPLFLGIVSWMLLSAVLAHLGILHRFNSLPPPIALLFATGFVGTIALGMSRWVRPLMELPLTILVAAQSFRILVEVLIHASSSIGLAPIQMTWSGYNFDIITGITALVLTPFAEVAPARLVLFWNCLGLALLSWVVGIAMISMPTRLQLMRPDNAWVASFPYVWLPTMLVTAALLGHIVVFRKLAMCHSLGRL